MTVDHRFTQTQHRYAADDLETMSEAVRYQAHIFNRLKHAGVGIATLASDRIGVLEVGLKGVMAELYLVNLSQKTSRGMRANAEQGLATGARTYGYRSQPGGAMAMYRVGAQVSFERNASRAWGIPYFDADVGGLWTGTTGSRLFADGGVGVYVYARRGTIVDVEVDGLLPFSNPSQLGGARAQLAVSYALW